MSRIKDASSSANGLVYYVETLGTAGSLGWTYLTYVTDGGGSQQVGGVWTNNDAAQQTYTTLDYDQYGNVTNKRDYGFQIGGAFQVRRRTNFTYSTDSNYTSRYLRS